MRSANRIAWRLIAAGLAGTIAGFAVFANIVSERRFADSEAGREILKRQWIEEGGRGGFAITSRVQMGQEAMLLVGSIDRMLRTLEPERHDPPAPVKLPQKPGIGCWIASDSDLGANMRPIDRFVEQFQRRDLRSHFLRENRIRPRELEEWVYPSEEQIREAEEAIGKSLPPSYKHLVRNFHPGELPFDFYWIGGIGTCWVDGVEVRLLDLVKVVGPSASFLIPLMSVGDCEEVCFDTRRADADGEYPLVHWDGAIHGSDPHPAAEFEVWAENLGELLLDWIDRLPQFKA